MSTEASSATPPMSREAILPSICHAILKRKLPKPPPPLLQKYNHKKGKGESVEIQSDMILDPRLYLPLTCLDEVFS